MGWNPSSARGLARRVAGIVTSAALALSVAPPPIARALPVSLATQASDDVALNRVNMFVVGPSATGAPELYANAAGAYFVQGVTAAHATEALLNRAGLTHASSDGEYGYYLSSITSPDTGEALSWNEDTGDYWQLFVDGELSEVGASEVVLRDGTEVLWAYGSTYDEASVADTDWRGFANAGAGVLPGVNTASSAQDAAWVASLKDDYLAAHPNAADASMGYVNVSDLVTNDGFVYVAVDHELQQRSAADGTLLATAPLAQGIGYTARPLFADGLLIVPEAGGALEAFRTERGALTRAWASDAVGARQQNSGALVAQGGKVYAATFEYASDYTVSSGYLICADIATGEVEWTKRNASSGYYWGGLCVAGLAGDLGVVGDDAGTLASFALTGREGASAGEALATLDLGAPVRSVPQASLLGQYVYVTTTNGVLHKVAVADDGTLTEEGQVKFAESSTGTPAFYSLYAAVGGTGTGVVQTAVGDDTYTAPSGRVALVRLTDMSLVATADLVEGGGVIPGDVKAWPVVSVGSSALNVYFTANGNPGALYSWDGVDGSFAQVVFEPDATRQNYCIAMPVAGRDGTLFYTNDSGSLFAIAPGELSWETEAGYRYLVDGRGTSQVGWQHKDGWYLLGNDGKMEWGWQYVDGAWYWLGARDDGRMATGWRCLDGTWYHFGPNGAMERGWAWVQGEWYWLGTSGAMRTGWQFVDGTWYYFDANGHMLRDQVVDGYQLSGSGAWLA